MRDDRKSTFDHQRCGTCGLPWESHTKDCSRHAYRPGAEKPEAPPPGVQGPTNGKALFAWLKEQEQRYGVGLLKYIFAWGKLQDFPVWIINWSAEQVNLAYNEACWKLVATSGQQPKPPTTFPTISQAAASGLREIIGAPGDEPKTLREFVREAAEVATPDPKPPAKRLADYSSILEAVRDETTNRRLFMWLTSGETAQTETGLRALIASIITAEVAHATASLQQQVGELVEERTRLLEEVGRLGARLEIAECQPGGRK